MTTNYEKIKNMNIDEMAQWFYTKIQPYQCELCNEWKAKCEDFVFCTSKDCKNGIKQWLEQECGNDN